MSVGSIAEEQENSSKILVLGDSLSMGYGIDARKGWVELLQERIYRAGYPYQVVNASISGDTTRGGFARLPKALDEHGPAVVVIALGGNDGLRGIPLKEIRANLSGMIDLTHRRGAKAVLIGVRLPANYGRAYRERYEATFKEVAASAQVAFVESLLQGVEERAELFQADGIHPGINAQPLMLDNVWPALQPLLASEPSSP